MTTIPVIIEQTWQKVSRQFEDDDISPVTIYPLIQRPEPGTGGEPESFVFPASVWSVSTEGPVEESSDSMGRYVESTDVQIDFRIDGGSVTVKGESEPLSYYMAVARIAKMFVSALPREGEHRLVSWRYLADTFGIELVLATPGLDIQARRVLAFTLTGSVC
ncbi:MAG: hypothetical protein OXF62_17815 [Caldilineaceae bacterium]|nr:hypothetical protein [Caldilineaceae bacterium]